jgi:hypothetical protein
VKAGEAAAEDEDEEDTATTELCRELEPLIREEFKLVNLARYLEEHPTDLLDESETKNMPLTLERINSLLSLCTHSLSIPSSEPKHEASIIEENDSFFDNLRLVYHQLLQLAQSSVSESSQATFSCRFMDSLLLLKVKAFVSIFGLCDEYLTNIGQRIKKVNLRKKFFPTAFDRVFVKSIQLGFTMASLVFSQVSLRPFSLLCSSRGETSVPSHRYLVV